MSSLKTRVPNIFVEIMRFLPHPNDVAPYELPNTSLS